MELAGDRPDGFTWHELAAIVFDGRSCAPSELRLVRNTCSNMVRAGELTVVGFVHTPGVCRPMRRMRWAAAQESPQALGSALQGVLSAWAGFGPPAVARGGLAGGMATHVPET